MQKRYPGHFFRRLLHFLIMIVPIFYYSYGATFSQKLSLAPEQLVSLLVILTLLFESLRLINRWQIFGQRDYEMESISAAAWTVFAMGLVLLQAPKIGVYGGALGIPLIVSFCFADPIMGEMRLIGASCGKVIFSGALAVSLVWIACVFLLGTPWWIIPMIVPLTVAAELPNLPWVDDNAVMLLVPLGAVLLLAPWM